MPLVLTLKKSSHSTIRMVVISIRIDIRCTLEMDVVRVLSLYATHDMVWCVMPIASSLTTRLVADRFFFFLSSKFIFRADSQKLLTNVKHDQWSPNAFRFDGVAWPVELKRH